MPFQVVVNYKSFTAPGSHDKVRLSQGCHGGHGTRPKYVTFYVKTRHSVSKWTCSPHHGFVFSFYYFYHAWKKLRAKKTQGNIQQVSPKKRARKLVQPQLMPKSHPTSQEALSESEDIPKVMDLLMDISSHLQVTLHPGGPGREGRS